MKQSVVKLMPRKKIERRGERYKQCLQLNYLHCFLLHLNVLWKLQKKKECLIGLRFTNCSTQLCPTQRGLKDALYLCYGLRPALLPTNCMYNKQFTVNHALNCFSGGSLLSDSMRLVHDSTMLELSLSYKYSMEKTWP